MYPCATVLLRPADFYAAHSRNPRLSSDAGNCHRKSFLHGNACDAGLQHRSGHPNGNPGTSAMLWLACPVDHQWQGNLHLAS